MFTGFAKVWTPIVLASRLKAGAPLGLTVAGEPIVLFRGEDGRPAALLDRCPHRGVKLSLGQVRGGCVECPFHAWRFGPDGGARHVPLNPDAKRERLFATAFPVREIAGLIWLFTGAGPAEGEPVLPDGLSRPDLARTFLQVDWNCHWTRAMENMLDSPHVPYVHRTTIGRAQAKVLRDDSRMEVTAEPTPTGAHSTMAVDGHASGASLDFHRPNLMELRIPIPGKLLRMHAAAVPMEANRTRMIIVGARDFMTWRVWNPFFNRANRVIADQDQAIVESSQPPEVPPPAQELSVATDRLTLQFRRYYYERLR